MAILEGSKILLITLDQVELKTLRAKFHADRTKPQGEVRKSRFSSFRDFAKKHYRRKWAAPALVLFHLLPLFLLKLVYTKDLRQDETVARKVAVE